MCSSHTISVFRLSLFTALIASLSSIKAAAPAGEIDLLDESSYQDFRVEGPEAQKASLSLAPLDTLGYRSALRLKTKDTASKPFAAQIAQRNRQPIRKGDFLLVHFYLRTIESSLESQEGLTEFVIENKKTFSKSIQFGASALKDWREFTIPFIADAAYAPGEASMIFRLGYQPQVIEIAGLTIKNFGPRENLFHAPTGLRRLSYPGIAADAPWRAEADKRIEQFRKADLAIRVVDASGQPVPDAEIIVRQTRHAYWFGAAARVDRLVQPGNPAEQEKYRGAVREMFNAITFENDLKWPFWQRNLDATLEADRWLHENGIALRGHVLAWPSRQKGLPESLFPLMEKPDELRQAILDHIRDITAKLQPPAAAWDVLNEAFNNHEFMDVLGDEAMVTWFQAARQGSPQSRLFINDWGIVSSRGQDEAHQAAFEKTISFLLEKGAPLDGIGVQGHFGSEPTSPEQMLRVLDRFARFGKEIQMTEYSTQLNNPDDAAIYLRDCLTVFFSHSSTSGFVLWGVRDGIGMKNKSFPFDEAWQLTPSGRMWKDLVFGKWWTNTTASADAKGSATARGFLGQYEIIARSQGRETRSELELRSGGGSVELKLPASK